MNMTTGRVVGAVIMILGLLGLMAWPVYALRKNKEDLSIQDTKDKIGNFYLDIKLHDKWSYLYYPMFLVRRFAFIMMPFVFMGYPAQQIQMLFFVHIFYVMFYIKLKPHAERSRFGMELFNEAMQLTLYYHMILFSQFNTDVHARFSYGYSFLYCLVAIMGVNIVSTMLHTIKVYEMSRKRALYEARLLEMDRWLEEQQKLGKMKATENMITYEKTKIDALHRQFGQEKEEAD